VRPSQRKGSRRGRWVRPLSPLVGASGLRGITNGVREPADDDRQMRAMFIAYVLVIALGIIAFLVIGLAHR
jgi:hypothetical protein